MYFDNHPAIVMEQNGPDDPGRFGDSCAETMRYWYLNKDQFESLLWPEADKIFRAFTTQLGYIRHPEAPWREDDFSGDQALPYYLVSTLWGMGGWQKQFEEHVKSAGYKTGNGTYLSIIWISVFYRAHGKQSWLTDLPVLLQAIWLRFFSWTYDDGVADHLNFFHVLLQAKRSGHTATSRLATWLMSHERFMRAIETYYKPESNSKWIIDAYWQTR